MSTKAKSISIENPFKNMASKSEQTILWILRYGILYQIFFLSKRTVPRTVPTTVQILVRFKLEIRFLYNIPLYPHVHKCYNSRESTAKRSENGIKTEKCLLQWKIGWVRTVQFREERRHKADIYDNGTRKIMYSIAEEDQGCGFGSGIRNPVPFSP